MLEKVKKWIIRQSKGLLEEAIREGEKALVEETMDYYVAKTGISEEKRETLKDFVEFYTGRAESLAVPMVLKFLDDL